MGSPWPLNGGKGGSLCTPWNGGVEANFGRASIVVSAWVKGGPALITEDDRVTVGLPPRHHRPFDGPWVGDVNVLIHDGHGFHRRMTTEGSIDGLARILLRPAVDADDAGKPATTSIGHVHVQTLHDFVDGRLDRWSTGQTHQGLVFRLPGNEGVEDGVSPVCHTIDGHHRLLTDVVDGSRDVNVRPFFCIVERDSAPHHIFGIGGNDDTVRSRGAP